MKRILKLTGIFLASLTVLRAGCFIAFRSESRDQLLARERYLASELTTRDNSPSLIGGEWDIVSISMTALAARNLAAQYPDQRESLLADVTALCERALTPQSRAFDTRMWHEDALASLDGPRGHIGYLGHLALTLDAYRALGGADPRLVSTQRHVISALARRAQASPSTYLDTYPAARWTADNEVVFAALGLADDLEQTHAHRALLDAHVAYAKEHLLDPRNGLVVFRVSEDGRPLGTARGSGVAWNAIYLPLYDAAFARDQAEKLRASMWKRLPFGAGIAEFPEGVDGAGDVDSGPVLFGVSTSGTGFGVAAMRTLGDESAVASLLSTAEFAGFTWQWNGRRRYLLGPLVGDAAVLAARTSAHQAQIVSKTE